MRIWEARDGPIGVKLIEAEPTSKNTQDLHVSSSDCATDHNITDQLVGDCLGQSISLHSDLGRERECCAVQQIPYLPSLLRQLLK